LARPIPVQRDRGAALDLQGGLRVLITIHPSALLRLRDEEDKRSQYEIFAKDLRLIEQTAKPSARLAPPGARVAG
jgi:uracil-DNA glycosylase